MADRPTRILILGGGFGGVYTALTLEKLLKREIRDRRVELGLISRDNYIVFQPMLPEVISGTIGLMDLVSPLRRLLPATEIHVREIQSIDLQNCFRLKDLAPLSKLASLKMVNLPAHLWNLDALRNKETWYPVRKAVVTDHLANVEHNEHDQTRAVGRPENFR